MGNLLDYLSQRGKIPFSVTPFYSVDALLLSMLAYVDLSGIVTEEGEEVDLHTACQGYFSRHTFHRPWKPKNYTERPALVMARMADCPRFARLTFSRYTQYRDENAQFAAVTIRPGDGSVFAAFRGTDSSVSGWKESFSLSYLEETPGQRLALAYLNDPRSRWESPFHVAGHSKGGNCALYAAAFCREEVRERIGRIYTFDSPGYREDLAASPEIAALLPRLHSFLPETSFIGRLLEHPGTGRVVHSTVAGLLQHDPATWEIRDGHFVESVTTGLGAFLDETSCRWLEGLDYETRRSFTDTLFSLFASTGEESFAGIRGERLRSTRAILSAFRALPGEKRREAFAVAGALLRSGGLTAAARLPLPGLGREARTSGGEGRMRDGDRKKKRP